MLKYKSQRGLLFTFVAWILLSFCSFAIAQESSVEDYCERTCISYQQDNAVPDYFNTEITSLA